MRGWLEAVCNCGVDLDGRELAAGLGERVGLFQPLGIEHPAPTVRTSAAYARADFPGHSNLPLAHVAHAYLISLRQASFSRGRSRHQCSAR